MKILRNYEQVNSEIDEFCGNCTSADWSASLGVSNEFWIYTYNAGNQLTITQNSSPKTQKISFIIQNSSFIINFEYSPFGKITRTTGDIASRFAFRFSSEYSDTETGLVYYNYRYYSPELGRWLSRDPIGEGGGVNLYRMIDNSPIRWIDYLGLVIDGPVGGGKKCEIYTYSFSRKLSTTIDRADFAAAITYWGSGSSCKICCSDGRKGRKITATVSANLGVEIGIASFRKNLKFSFLGGSVKGEYKLWLGLRLYGGLKGAGEGSMSYDSCKDKFYLEADIYASLYAGFEIGGEGSAKGVFNLGWLGKYSFDVGFTATGTGRVIGKYSPKLICDAYTCHLGGPINIKFQAFVDLGVTIQKHKFTKRWNFGESNDIPIVNDLSYKFPNPFSL